MVLTLGLLVRGFFISRKPQHRADPRNLCGIRITYNLKCAQQNLLNVRSKSPAHALRKLDWQLPHNIFGEQPGHLVLQMPEHIQDYSPSRVKKII